MSLMMQNNVLQAAEKKVESQLTPDNRANYMKIVTAGMKLGLAKGPDGILGSLRHSKTPIKDCAMGAVNLCLLMRKQSRGTMPLKALVPAAMSLMLQALDFVDKSKLAKVGTPELVQATHIFTDHLFKQLGITPAMIRSAAGNVQAITQDPAKMDVINRKAGIVKAPGAGGAPPAPEASDVPA